MKAVVKEKVSKGHIVPIQSYGGKGPSIFDEDRPNMQM